MLFRSADWRHVYSARKKIKKSPKKTIELVQNPDILAELGSRKNGKVAVGFALETENLEKNALKKLKDKNLDLIVANRLGKGSELFGDKAIDVVTIDRFGNRARLRGKSKQELARIILGKALKLGTSYES